MFKNESRIALRTNQRDDRGFSRRFSRILLAGLLLSGSGGFAAAQGDFDLQTIQAALDSYADGIRTLEGRFRGRLESEPVRPGSLTMEGLAYETKFAVDLRNGWIRLDRSKSWAYSAISADERFSNREQMATDGAKYYALGFTLGKSPLTSTVPSDVPHNLNVFAGSSQIEQYHLPWHFAGLRLKRFGVNLGELLRSHDARVVGAEEIDGARCVRILIQPTQLEVWLDPRHGFLPRRMQYGAENAETMGYRVFENLEFNQFGVANEDLNDKRWFPVRTRVHSHKRLEEVEIVDLTINAPIDRTRFRIDASVLPIGVRIRDQSTRPPRRAYTGGSQGERIWKERQRLIDEETTHMEPMLGIPSRKRGLPSATNPIEADAPARISSTVWLLVVGSLTLIAIGVRQFMKARK